MNQKAAQDSQAPSAPPFAYFTPMAIFLFCGLAGSSLWAAFRSALWVDEGGINYKGWLIVQGHVAAYKDILTQLPPLGYYSFGQVQSLFGPSFLVGRIFAVICYLLGALFCVLAVKRIAGAPAALLALMLLLLHPYSTGFLSHATHLSVTMVFCSAAVYLLSRSSLSKRATIASVVFASLAALTMPAAIILVLGVIVFLFWDQGKKTGVTAIIAFVGTFVLFLLPFVGQLDTVLMTYWPAKIFSGIDTAYPYRYPFNVGFEFKLFVGFLVGFLPFVLLVLFAPRYGDTPKTDRPANTQSAKLIRLFLILFFATALFWAWQKGATMRINYARDMLAFLPLLLVPAAVLGARIFQNKFITEVAMLLIAGLIIAGVSFLGIPKFVLGTVLVVLLLLVLSRLKPRHKLLVAVLMVPAIILSATLSPQLWVREGQSKVPDLTRIQKVGQSLRQQTDPTDKVFAYGAAHYLLEAGRIGFAPLIDREYAMAFDQDDFWVKDKNLYTPSDMQKWMRVEADAVLLDYLGHNRLVAPHATQTVETLKSKIPEFFTLTQYINPGDVAGNGGRPVSIYIRKKSAAPATESPKALEDPDGVSDH